MGMNLTFANSMEEVRLQNYEIKTINVPKNTEYEKIYSMNPDDDDVDSYYFTQEEDVFENRAGKVFSNFVNDKVINNKVNEFSSKI